MRAVGRRDFLRAAVGQGSLGEPGFTWDPALVEEAVFIVLREKAEAGEGALLARHRARVDRVWVESPAGKVKVRARVYPGIMPAVVALPLGQGHTALGRYARGVGANPMTLLGAGGDPMSGLPALATWVRVFTRPNRRDA